MPRLFTGLAPPEATRARLAALGGGPPGARWIEPADQHLTLRFFGDVDRPTANDLYDALSELTPPRGAVVVELEALAVFGGERPRALVARAKLTPALAELQAAHERLARRVGLAPETRKFTPHVTLARLRGVGPREAADMLAARPLLPTRFETQDVVLYSARDSVGGGPYVTEATFPLDRRGDSDGAAPYLE